MQLICLFVCLFGHLFKNLENAIFALIFTEEGKQIQCVGCLDQVSATGYETAGTLPELSHQLQKDQTQMTLTSCKGLRV